nr:MAG TPA: hypothetical protein [Caudoviricetes sp.]
MSKFKVGDKVVKADGEKWTSGEKYKFITKINFWREEYLLSNSIGWWDEKELKLYEGVKEMKELTFKEVIANIKEGEVWDDGFLKIQMKRGTISIGSLNEEPFKNIIGFVINPCKKFKLQRKEYKFDEAFKAYEEGKEIESCEGCKFKRCDKDVVLIIDFAGDKIKRGSCEDLFSIKEIRGKWYIND